MTKDWKFDQDNTMANAMNNTTNLSDLGANNDLYKKFPRKVKLEISTNLESLVMVLMVLSLSACIPLFYYYYGEQHLFNTYTIGALCISIFFIILVRNVDEYYVLDTGRQALMLRSIIFSRDNYTIFAHFKTIDAVVANGRYNNGGKNRPNYWTYRTEIVLRTGKVIPIDDWHREDLLQADAKARNFANLACIDYVQGQLHSTAAPIKLNGKYSFIVKERTFMDSLKSVIPLLIVFALMFFLPMIMKLID